MNLLRWLEMGGPVAWIIVFCFLLALGVFFERMFHLRRAQIAFLYFLKGVFNVLRRGHVQEAISLCSDTPGPIARLALSAIEHRADSREQLEAELTRVGHQEISRMERRRSVLSVIAQLAPLMGLLGTFFGILRTVTVLRSQSPLVQVGNMTDGLVQACVTSIFGLLVALPVHTMFTLLVVRIDRIVLQMEEAASQITAFFTSEFPGDAPPADGAKNGEGPHG